MKKILFILAITLIGFLSLIRIASGQTQTQNQHPPQLEYYPIIFIHGHGGKAGDGSDEDVERTWDYVTGKLNNINGFSYYGKIWEKTQLPGDLPAKTIFSFNFYRSINTESMGTTKGKIGAIPIIESQISSMKDIRINRTTMNPLCMLVTRSCFDPSCPFTSVDSEVLDFKSTYFDTNRVSYAQRLKIAVDKVIQATHAKKVILVSHSMGGLVARAYIRWLGGEKKVFKLLTIATPNHGISSDGRAAFEQMRNPSDWQDGGEYLEMSTKGHFSNKSFSDWLNDGWEQYCATNGVRYATIAGNNNPFAPFCAVGNNSDGVIDRDSVLLIGAEFNALSKTSHIGKFISDIPDEFNITKSTNTLEIIKRWLFEDRLHVNGQFTQYSFDFGKNILVNYELKDYAINSVIEIYNMSDRRVYLESFPLYPGYGDTWQQYILNGSLLNNLGYGAYIASVHSYDMNGEISSFRYKLGKFSDDTFKNPITWFSNIQDTELSYNGKTFTIQSDMPISDLHYKINDDNWTNWQTSSMIYLSNLPQGVNTLYVQTLSNGFGVSNVATYSWIEYGLYINTNSMQDGYVGAQYNQNIKVTGGIYPYKFFISNGNLPNGLTLDTSTGVLTGTPTSAGNFGFTVQATDANSVKTIKPLTLNVLTLPNVSTSTLTDAYVGSPYNQTLTGTGGKSPYSWSIAGILPAGLTLNPATGVISGTPTAATTTGFTIQVNDKNNKTANKTLAIKSYPALGIGITRITDAYVGTAYNQTLTATGGKVPYVWSITNGALPAGLTFNTTTGIIGGKPTVAGTSNISFQVSDANGVKASQALTATVYTIPAISTIKLADTYVGTAYSQTLAVSGGKSPYTWSITAGALPAGLSLNSSTGIIVGTPTAALNSGFTVQVKDANNQTATKVFSTTGYTALVRYGWNSQCQGGQVKSNTFEFTKIYKSFDLAYNTGSTDNTSYIAEAYNTKGQWVRVSDDGGYNKGNYLKSDIAVSDGFTKIKVTHYNSRNYCTNNSIFGGCMNWLYNNTYFEVTPKQYCQPQQNLIVENVYISWHVNYGTYDKSLWISCPDRNYGGWGCFPKATLTIPMTKPSLVERITMSNGTQWNTVTGIIIYAVNGSNEQQIWSGNPSYGNPSITFSTPVLAEHLKVVLNNSINRSTLTINGVYPPQCSTP